jgi:hypothetical protein
MTAVLGLTLWSLRDKQQDFPINIDVDVSFLHEPCKGDAIELRRRRQGGTNSKLCCRGGAGRE